MSVIFNLVNSPTIPVQNNRFLTAALMMFLLGVYPLTIADYANAQPMMPTPFNPTPTPLSDQTILLVIVAVVVLAVVIIAVVFYVASRKKETPHVYKPTIAPSTIQPQTVAPKEAAKPFDVFLCYKKSSGKDYADHLKSGLEEVGLHAFEDCKDIPLTVNTEEGWAKIRDQALTESRYFVLIMTPGFELSSEVIKEISIARKQANKTFVFFRHRSMGRKIVVNLGDEVFDISQLEQVSFESKEELLRYAINILKK